jgi:hypothetical protein
MITSASLSASALHHRIEIALDHAETALERFAPGIEHRDRDTGVGEAHGDAATHGARADDRRRLDGPCPAVRRDVGDLARLALGEEEMNERFRLRRRLRAVHQLRLVLEAALQRERRGGLDRLDRGQRGGAVRVLLAGLLGESFDDPGRCASRIDFHGAGRPGRLARCDQVAGELECGTTQVALDDRIENAQLERPLGIDGLRSQDELERAFDPDQARHALRPPGAGDDAERDFGHRETRVGQGDAIVQGERDLDPATHHRTVQGGDRRNGQGLETIEETAVGLLLGRPPEFCDVGAGEERVAGAEQHQAPDVMLGFQRIEHLQEALADRDIDRVDGRVIDREHDEVTLPRHGDEGAPFR